MPCSALQCPCSVTTARPDGSVPFIAGSRVLPKPWRPRVSCHGSRLHWVWGLQPRLDLLRVWWPTPRLKHEVCSMWHAAQERSRREAMRCSLRDAHVEGLAPLHLLCGFGAARWQTPHRRWPPPGTICGIHGYTCTLDSGKPSPSDDIWHA